MLLGAPERIEIFGHHAEPDGEFDIAWIDACGQKRHLSDVLDPYLRQHMRVRAFSGFDFPLLDLEVQAEDNLNGRHALSVLGESCYFQVEEGRLPAHLLRRTLPYGEELHLELSLLPSLAFGFYAQYKNEGGVALVRHKLRTEWEPLDTWFLQHEAALLQYQRCNQGELVFVRIMRACKLGGGMGSYMVEPDGRLTFFQQPLAQFVARGLHKKPVWRTIVFDANEPWTRPSHVPQISYTGLECQSKVERKLCELA